MTDALGVIGGGQLGMFFCRAARKLGFESVVLDPDPRSIAGGAADHHIVADYDDRVALSELSRRCVGVTVEFENVPHESLEFVADHTRVRPGAHAVQIAADRQTEKSFLSSTGHPVAPWSVLLTHDDLGRLKDDRGWRGPSIVKTTRFGYDGHGQRRIDDIHDLDDAWSDLGRQPCVIERLLPLDEELSVVVARSIDGTTAAYPATRNVHVAGILDTSSAPFDGETALRAEQTAVTVATALDYVGVLGVEFFVVGGQLLINEIAPRPHNSGHWTLDAGASSQFEQQVRCLVGLPLAETSLASPSVAMVNLLGDLWEGGEPRWSVVDSDPDAHLHLYGKQEPRPGRKMGHLTVCADTVDDAVSRAQSLRKQMAARPLH